MTTGQTAPTGAVTVSTTGNYTDGADLALGAVTVKRRYFGNNITTASGITTAETTAAVN